jgi:hypothetical protein
MKSKLLDFKDLLGFLPHFALFLPVQLKKYQADKIFKYFDILERISRF